MSRLLIVLLLVVAMAQVALSASTIDLYVDVKGNDAWNGLAPVRRGSGGPVATLARARDVVRAMRKSGKCRGATVVIHVGKGVYCVTESLSLGSEDSGREGSPIVWRGSGSAVLMGGRPLSGFKPVRDAAILRRLPLAARKAVLQCDLKRLGIRDFGRISPGGFADRTPATHMELSHGGETMVLARWPNEEWERTGEVRGRQVVDGSGKRRGVQADSFTYINRRVERWKASDDIWMHGYWFQDWADKYLQVKSFDRKHKQLVIRPPHSGYGYKKGARYRYINVLEELDAPKEYYLDAKSGILYFWPPRASRNLETSVSVLKDPVVLCKGVSHVIFEGITIASSRGDAVRIEGGSNVTVKDCTIRNIGNKGIVVRGGQQHSVINCVVTQTGSAGVQLSGGDRKTLRPANHVVENCDISHFGKWFRTYHTGILLSGVGIRASHNELHEAPHCAIHYNGNDHVIEYNEIYKTCLETSDVGAIYTTRDWTARGTKIRYNYIHDNAKYKGHLGAIGIYLDDFTSGQEVYGNVVVRSHKGIQHCSGRDNLIANNILAGCSVGIHVNNRHWAHKLVNGRKGSWDMYGKLNRVPYKGPAYAKYPNLAKIMDEEPLSPRYNVIQQNILVDCSQPFRIDRNEEKAPKCNDIKSNHIVRNPGFVSPAKGDYSLRARSPLLRAGFKNIPVDRIGRR